jgi:hypothetical protein
MLIGLIPAGKLKSQPFIKTTGLLERSTGRGSLTIEQSPSVDTLISRHILANSNLKTADGKQGMWGYRIQVYLSGVRNAYEEANKVMGQVLKKFPMLSGEVEFNPPVWYMVRIGNYRTKTEAYRDLMTIRKEYPDAYAVKAKIIFPDLIKNHR